MPLSKTEIRESLARGILTQQHVDALSALSKEMGTATILSMKNVLIFFGGLIGIGAISIWYVINNKFTGWEVVGFATLCAVLGILATSHFLWQRNEPTVASVTATFVVFSVTLGVFGYQIANGHYTSTYHDFHVYVDKRWLTLEIATLIAAMVMLGVYRLPFIMMPVALVLWYMGMDLTPLIAEYLQHRKETVSDYTDYWNLRLWISVWFGIATMVTAFLIDISTRGEKDFAFWPYLAGLMSFWWGLSLMGSDDMTKKLIYIGINVGLIVLGPFLMRKIFIVMGGIGFFYTMTDLAIRHFVNSADFLFNSIAASVIIVSLGLLWGRYAETIERKTEWMVPQKLRDRWAPA